MLEPRTLPVHVLVDVRCAKPLFSLNKDDYLRKYHQRSNAESTFSAFKRLFGSSLRSKSDRTMRNELLARVVGYNITCVIHEMYKMGVNPEFVVRPRPAAGNAN